MARSWRHETVIAWFADLWENVRVALDGLLANKLRSTLTMLGVIIGVGAVIALMSIGAGAQAAITEQITSIGTNLLIVIPGAPEGEGGVRGSFGSASNLTYADAQAIADTSNVPDAKYVAPIFDQNAQIIFGAVNINASVTGVTEDYLPTFNLTVAQGRFIDAGDVNKRSDVAVLGYQAAQDLFGSFDPLDQKIKVSLPGGNGRVSLTVIGVLEEKGGAGFNSPDNAVLVPISTAQNRLFNGRNARGQLIVSDITVVATSQSTTTAVQDEIDALLRRRHDLTPSEDADFRVLNQADLLSAATQVTGILTAFLGAIAGISLLVGGIGIMNIMLVSVTERTREIGIRKAVGARRADILVQFLMEAIVLSVLGGTIGILLGAGLAKIVSLTGLVSSLVTLNSVLLAVGFSMAVGLFFGIYPANQAAKLNPIEALRYE
jgi:putative ABC transport system permease protein